MPETCPLVRSIDRVFAFAATGFEWPEDVLKVAADEDSVGGDPNQGNRTSRTCWTNRTVIGAGIADC